MRIYLAGPMRGYPQFNFPAFDTAAYGLRRHGHEVFSPAERDRSVYGADFGTERMDGDDKAEKVFDLREALGADVAYIAAEAEAIALLPGWEKSAGALAEWALAKALDLKFIYL